MAAVVMMLEFVELAAAVDLTELLAAVLPLGHSSWALDEVLALLSFRCFSNHNGNKAIDLQ